MPPDLPNLARVIGGCSAESHEMVRRFKWEIRSINVYLEALRQVQANVVGITGPQWMIVMALADFDRENGVPVNVVSKLMHVDSSFVTTQSKLLEKKGLLRRKPSTSDARVVQMSLTDKAYKHLAGLAAQQDALDEFVFGEFDVRELTEFANRLAALRHRLEKARLKVALDF
ncbi:MarR family transcriptional regulator [Bradyrhizobium sp. CB3481]|uniref:MarR family winged helix-turn-helix transcriptional regulator n=1 Tax=Bradyrhizobium sp. CB3481 TaxID=3039158 RepID=UPI0024B0FC44|nr:MarR family transcriptional regulator [Bradyrhizobium sp. CB3481]WFU20606.1 MarR family transcriptional regulator [Bradyrhizobium sp. CB3481]